MLTIVATPIGNLGDMSLRAIEALKACDLILCEDTRTSSKLLNHFSISKPLKAYHDHSKDTDRDAIIGQLKEGKSICLISDAGSPLISDPGYKLIKLCQEHGLDYTTAPGASSLIAALQLSGLPSDQFYFGGFLEAKEQAKTNQIETMLGLEATLIFFETAKRIQSTLKVLENLSPSRNVAIVREITKKFEQVLVGVPAELLSNIEGNPLKGEIVLLIEKNKSKKTSGSNPKLLKKIETLVRYMPLKEVARYLEEETGVSKKEIYNLGLELKK